MAKWPRGLYSVREVTEVKLVRSSGVKVWMGDLGGLTSQLTLPSFGRNVKLGVPCVTCGMHSEPKLALSS